jgi:hypothetical protein
MPLALLKKGEHLIMLENIPIAFIILLLFVGFVMATTQFKSRDIKQEQEKMQALELTEITQTVISLNQLQCSIDSYKEESCIDFVKLSTINLQNYDLLGFSTVKIRYKTLLGMVEEKIVYNNVKESFNGQKFFFTPITIYNSDSKENYFGILEVTLYT